MNHVAEAAGVTKPVLYQHFASKRDLLPSCSRTWAVAWSRRSSRPTARAPVARASRSRRAFGAYFRSSPSSVHAFQVLFGRGYPPDPEFVAEP